MRLAARLRQRLSEGFEFAGPLDGLNVLDNVSMSPALRSHKRVPTPPKRRFASISPSKLRKAQRIRIPCGSMGRVEHKGGEEINVKKLSNYVRWRTVKARSTSCALIWQ